MAAKKRDVLVSKVLKSYFNPSFPGSFSAINKFRAGLKEKLDIDLSYREVRNILKRNLWYQTSVVKVKRFPTRKVYSQGVGLEGIVDAAYLYLPVSGGKIEKRWAFLVCLDLHSRYVYTQALKKVNPQELKLAFGKLFRIQNMPRFPVLR